MEWFILLFFFWFGLVIGSYLNVAIYRLPLHLSTVKGRSFCPQCHHTLSVLDLIPVFSWLGLRGKCRYCHASISLRYPLIEILTGVLYALCGCYYGATLTAMLHCLFLSILIVRVHSDSRRNRSGAGSFLHSHPDSWCADHQRPVLDSVTM